MIGGRTRSRQVALQVLFSLDLREGETHLKFDPVTLQDADASEEVKAFARSLVEGVIAALPRIDELIRDATENWELDRIAAVDRNILRLSIHELLAGGDVPPAVAIDEAIELAKRFGGAGSGAFVNGVLDRVRKELGVQA